VNFLDLSIMLDNCNGMHIKVVFLQPGPNAAFMNRLVAKATGGFCHVELIFPDVQRNQWLATSIHSNESLYLRTDKTFSNPGYTVLCLWITGEECCRMRQFAHKQFESNIQFDETGMYLALLPVQLFAARVGKTFCSKYVLDCLQHTGIPALQQYNSNIISPSKLWSILYKHERCVVGALHSRMQDLQNNDKTPLLHLLDA